MSNTQQEIWKDIKDYEGIYQVSNLGKVKSLDRIDSGGRFRPEKILKQNNNKGYLKVTLCKNKSVKYPNVHRLVALAFIPNPDNKLQVNHKDENKKNNCVDNLDWVTAKENANYGTRIDKIVSHIDYKESTKNNDYSAMAKLVDRSKVDYHSPAHIAHRIKMHKNNEISIYGYKDDTVIKFDSITKASNYIGGESTGIHRVLKGKQEQYLGWNFKYAQVVGDINE